jgi:hypothetical protein
VSIARSDPLLPSSSYSFGQQASPTQNSVFVLADTICCVVGAADRSPAYTNIIDALAKFTTNRATHVNILAADRPARALIKHAATASPVATGRATVIVRCTAPRILTALIEKITRLVRTAANAIADIIIWAAGSIYAQTRAAIAVDIATGVAARDAADAGHGGGVAVVRAAVSVAGASARNCVAASAVDTGLAPGAGSPTAADASVTAAAGVAMAAIAIGTTLGARSVAAIGCRPRTAGGGRGAVAVAAGVSHTADR